MNNLPSSDQLRVGTSSQDDLIDIGALLSTVWRGKWLIAFVVVVAIAAAAFYALSVAVPTYRSSAVVILETEQESVVDLQSVVGGLSGDTSAVNSEVEVLRARSLMEKVVERLDLTRDPEFNATLREDTLVDVAKARVMESVRGAPAPAPQVADAATQRRILDSTINVLLDKLTIRNVPNSFVFQITAETENAAKSALIADTVVELYILNQIEVKFDATEQATTWLTNRVAELQVQLEEAEARVSDFSATTDLVSIESLQGLERQLKELRDRIDGAEAATIASAELVAALDSAESDAARAEIANDPQLDRLIQRDTTDPAVLAALETRFDQVRSQATLEQVRSQQQLEALRVSAPQLEAQIAEQGQDLIVLQQLQREAEANRLLYEYFLARLKETSAQEGIQRADSRVLSYGVVAQRAASPRVPLILAMAGILGIIIGIAIVLLRESGNKGFRTARELERHTGQTVLGQIPVIPARRRKGILNYMSEKPTSAAVEAVRNFRTSVLLSDPKNPPKVIVSTSCVPGEGKTTNSLALSHNLVGMGNKVLLVEGDIRRRTFNQYFDNIPARGLVSLLSKDATLEDVVFRDNSLDADLIAGERSNINAADLFASDRFTELLGELRDVYDYIIIDTPPVLVVPDARIIAQSADAFLFTVKWDSTSREQVDEAMRLIRDANLSITGLVLSQISPRGMRAYGYGGKYGAYAGYGSKYYTN